MQFDEISLQPCTIEDAEALAVIGSATFLESFAGVLEGTSILLHCQKQHSAEIYRTYLSKTDTQAWLAIVQPGDAPVGYLMLTRPDLPLADITEQDIELKRIYLFTRFQRSGAGRLLLNRSLDAARHAGKTRVLLGVFAGNDRALAFYRKNGFKELGKRTFQIGTSIYDDLILGRAL